MVGIRGNEGILRSITASQERASTSLAQIASGNRLVKAGIDPAGNAIAASLRSDIAALTQAAENTQSGVSLVNTAEGGLSSISDLVSRGRELAIQSANGTLNPQQRASLNNEFKAVTQEIDRIGNTAEFNGQKLLNGELGANATKQVNIQVGSGSSPDNQLNLNVVEDTRSKALGIDKLDISTAQGALQAMDPLKKAQDQVTAARGQVGAIANRLTITANNLHTTVENLSKTESSIAGTDIAKEIGNLRQAVQQTGLSVRTLTMQNRQNETLLGGLLNTSI
jgi:flagellin